MKEMKRVLVVNDDGYKAAGIRALIKQLSTTFDVTAVAPAHEQSWMGKSISGHRDLLFEPAEHYEFKGHTVDGTPADSAQIGMYELFDGSLPDFVVSGINHGANVGVGHILSSGTVGAALEAAIQGVPAFASSVWNVKHANQGVDFSGVESVRLFEVAANITQAIIEKVMAKGFPKGIQVISVNLPHDVRPDAKWVVTKPHSEVYGKLFLSEEGVFRNKGYREPEDSMELDSDLAALARGHVSIIPIFIEITSHEKRAELARILDAELA